jgi:glycosyltransferase involved in cell wall biosynthesis
MQDSKKNPAKQIIMLQALANNERGWAKVMSWSGRVSLAQIEGFNYMEHIEVWENGECIFSTEPRQSLRSGWLDAMTFGFVLCLTALKRAWPVVKTQRSDVIIANANSMAMAAVLLRLVGRTRKVVCLVSDYFPPHGKLHVRIYRRISSLITSALCRLADEAWTLSPRITTVRANPRNFLLPLYINNEFVSSRQRDEIIYIGIPSPDHALDILFDICRRRGIRVNIVGESTYLQSIKHLAPEDAIFHGFISDRTRIKDICARCFCGYAVYRNVGPQNYSYYGIPSKTLNYLASNTPVITTNVADFSQYFEKYGIGRIVEPKTEHIEAAVLDLKSRPGEFYEAINRFRETWNGGVEQFYRERLKVLL